MYPPATFPSGHVNDPISIQIGTRVTQIDSKWRAQCVLRMSIGVCVNGRAPDTVLGSRLSDAAVIRLGLVQGLVEVRRTYSAISPRFAINIEVKGEMHADASLTVELCLRTSTLGTPKKSLRVPEALRRRDCSVMKTVASCRFYRRPAFQAFAIDQGTSATFNMEWQSGPN